MQKSNNTQYFGNIQTDKQKTVQEIVARVYNALDERFSKRTLRAIR